MAISAPSGGAAQTTAYDPKANYTPALSSLITLFFMMGFITCFNDILIPYLKILFGLNYTEVMLINTCFFGAYFVMSIPSGKIAEKLGYKKAMIIGFLIASLGCFLFYPAAAMRVYALFLVALFILATGITLLQTAGNPYVAVLGSPETASSRLTLTQAFNSLATTIAPMVGATLVLKSLPATPEILNGISDFTKLNTSQQEAYNSFIASINISTLQNTYLALAGVFIVIAVLMGLMKLPQITGADVDAGQQDTQHSSAWGYKHLVLGAVGIFTYVGAEVAIGSFLVNYLGQPEVMGLKEHEAGHWVSYYWGGAMVGRFLASYVLTRINPAKVLTFNALAAASLVVATMVLGGTLSAYTILAVGLMNSLMFPTIFTLALKGLGKYTDQGSGILCTAIVGGAVVPLLQGFFADSIGIRFAFFLPVLCYLYIAYYGAKGHAADAE